MSNKDNVRAAQTGFRLIRPLQRSRVGLSWASAGAVRFRKVGAILYSARAIPMPISSLWERGPDMKKTRAAGPLSGLQVSSSKKSFRP